MQSNTISEVIAVFYDVLRTVPLSDFQLKMAEANPQKNQ
jgi:hypothetical protein